MIEISHFTIPQLIRLRFTNSIKTWGRNREKVCKDCDILPDEYDKLIIEMKIKGRRYGGDKSE